MKLRNKKTGEIGYLIVGKGSNHYVVTNNLWESCGEYNSLAELNAEWEDAPKEHWFVDAGGEVEEAIYLTENDKSNLANFGNYFETKEEAEKAVEKLKAWKRLKDAGFNFTGFEETDRGCLGDFTIYCYIKPDYTRPQDEVEEDLDLLFGGEE